MLKYIPIIIAVVAVAWTLLPRKAPLVGRIILEGVCYLQPSKEEIPPKETIEATCNVPNVPSVQNTDFARAALLSPPEGIMLVGVNAGKGILNFSIINTRNSMFVWETIRASYVVEKVTEDNQ